MHVLRQTICSRLTLSVCLFLFICMSGCFQLETRIRLKEDGSAVISERVQFSRRLLDLGGKKGSKLDMKSLLEKKAFEDRMRHMGPGIKLVSHKIRSVPNGGQEALVEYQIDDLTAFRYISPFVRHPEHADNKIMGFEITPVLKGSYLGDKPGELCLRVVHPAAEKKEFQAVDEKASVYKPVPPVTVQTYRELQPIIRDILKGLKVKVTFESYAPIHCSFSLRGFELEGIIREVDLIDISDTNMDKYGVPFFMNEEIYLDLIRWRLDSKRIRENLEYASVNKTLPILMMRSGAVWFPPSRELYDKLIKGVDLDFGAKGGGIRKAPFEEIGYKPMSGYDKDAVK